MKSKTIKNLYHFGKQHIKPVNIKTWVAVDLALLALVASLSIVFAWMRYGQ